MNILASCGIGGLADVHGRNWLNRATNKCSANENLLEAGLRGSAFVFEYLSWMGRMLETLVVVGIGLGEWVNLHLLFKILSFPQKLVVRKTKGS